MAAIFGEILKYSGIYGAIIATFALLWNIHNARKSRETKLRIKISGNTHSILAGKQRTPLSYTYVISIEAINTGSRTIEIDKVRIKSYSNRFWKKGNGEKYLVPKNELHDFSTIEPGKKIKDAYEYEKIANMMDFDKEKYLILEIIDTLGKKHSSNVLKTKNLEQQSVIIEEKNAALTQKYKAQIVKLNGPEA